MENVIVTPKKMMKISELFSLSFKIYENKFWPLMGLIVLPALMLVLLALVFGLYFVLTTVLAAGTVLSALTIVLALLALLAVIFLIIFSVLSKIALALVVKENLAEFSIFAMLKKAREYWKSYFWIGFLGGLLTVIGFILFIIPGIILAIYWCLATWIFLDQGTRGWTALKQSQAMVSGYWWAIFLRFAVPMVIFMVIISLPTAFMEEKSQVANIYSFIVQIISVVLTPFLTAYVFNIYKNLKEIKA